MGFGDLFSRKAHGQQPPAPGTPANIHDQVSHAPNELALNADSRHAAWKNDCITTSTGGESMRISTVRQLSRTLGTILAAVTNNSEQSQELLREILRANPTVGDYPTLLNMTVEAIVSADSFKDSTPAVVRAWRDLARDHQLDTRLVILGLVAATRDTCTEMLQDLLSKPAHADSHASMDGTIRTFFKQNGDVKEINVQVLRGHFSSAFVKSLRQAESGHQERQKEAARRGEKPSALEQELAHVILTVDNSFRRANDIQFFNLTSADFIQAYLAATFDYAAAAYADRVRTGQA